MTRYPFRLPAGPVDLTSIETSAAPGFKGGKKKGKAALFALGDELSDLQERLFAEGRSGSERRVLLVLQGMDSYRTHFKPSPLELVMPAAFAKPSTKIR